MKDLLDITKDLVRIPSVSGNQEELDRVLTYVETFFSDLNTNRVQLKRGEHEGVPYLLVGKDVEDLQPLILILCHLDVVPADEALFEPQERNGKLYGRGVCDMKGQTAAMLDIYRSYLQAEEALPNITLAFTCDEEIGGMHGANYLVNTLGFRPEVALVPDSGRTPNELVLLNKGVFHVRLTATGTTGHGSRPWLGDNAIDKLLRDYLRLKDHFDAIDQSDTKDRWYNTCNIGTIEGGQAINQIPDHASCQLDIRFTEHHTPDDIRALLEKTLQETTFESIVTARASSTHAEHPYVQLYGNTVQEELDLEPIHECVCGGDDGRFFTEHGIPVIASRPLCGDEHSPHEWVDIQSLHTFRDLYNAYLPKLLERATQERATQERAANR